MDKANEHVSESFMTYNGFNRPALVAGIPLMLLLFTAFFAVLTGFPAIFLWGIKGIIIPVICALFLFIVKLACENDSNALRVIRLNLMGLLLKIRHRDLIIGYSSIR
ncbi:conjugal transfer protein TraD [Salmonella enterica]|nr:conjugal transfer protein TraD [Salmonella enterica]